MPHKEEILKVATSLVESVRKSLQTGAILDSTLVSLGNPGEEILEDLPDRLPVPFPSDRPDLGA